MEDDQNNSGNVQGAQKGVSVNNTSLFKVGAETHNHNGVDAPVIDQWSLDNRYLPIIRLVYSGTDSASETVYIKASEQDLFVITNQTSTPFIFGNPLGLSQDGQKLMIRLRDNGTPCAFTFGSEFASTSIILPTTTVASTWLYMGFIRNATSSTWDLIASV